MGAGESNAIELFFRGGPVMWPILLCSVIAVSIVVQKMLYFATLRTDTDTLQKNVFNLLKQDRIREALAACQNNPSPIAKILQAGILKFGCPREEIKQSVDEVSYFEIPKLENRLTLLATVAQTSTLLGLLGTVSGLILCFQRIEQKASALTAITPVDLSGGLWEALLTTLAGLLVAIPSFVAYHYLVNRVQGFTLEMERAGADLTNLLIHLAEAKPLSVETPES